MAVNLSALDAFIPPLRAEHRAQAAASIRSTSCDDFAQVEGLGQDLGLFGGARSGVQRHGGKAGDEHDFEGGIQLDRPLGQLDPVHARHHDIGEEQVEGQALDAFKGVAAVAEIGHRMAGLDQRRGKELAQRFIVFRQKDMRHVTACPPLLKTYNRQSVNSS